MKKLYTTLLLTILLTSCSGDGGLLDLFVPNLSNQWESNRGTFFFFTADERDVNESTLTGNEQSNVGDIHNFTGRFKDYDIEFTFLEGPEKNVKYTGKFIKESDPLTIKATGTNGVKLEIVQRLNN